MQLLLTAVQELDGQDIQLISANEKSVDKVKQPINGNFSSSDETENWFGSDSSAT